MTLAEGTGTLSGNTATTSGGVAMFSSLSSSTVDASDELGVSVLVTSAGSGTPLTATSETFAVLPLAQTIHFPEPVSSSTYSPGLTFGVSATASSGLTVSFTTMTPAVCAIIELNLPPRQRPEPAMQILSAGVCKVIATQPGNVDCAAATPVK
jgi:uncharacterized protein YaiE (UPF0345 family)